MSEDVIKKAQQAQMRIMLNIHKLCIDKNLTYYIIGGTALGAVRHHGFIPWDPDIDIAMPRKDYDLFTNLYSKELEPEYSCLFYKNTHNHESPHALVVMNGSHLNNRHDKYNGVIDRKVYVDIFPLDIAPSDKSLQKRQAAKIKRLQKVKYYKIATIYSSNTKLQRIMKRMLRWLLSFIDMDRLNKKLDNVFKMYSNDDFCSSELICSMASHYSYKKQCMSKFVYGTATLIEFENHLLYGPEKINEYLSQLYGDYMQLPSVEEQNKWYEYLDDIEIMIES